MISKTRLKHIFALKQKKNRFEKQQFLIEGYRLCWEAIQSDFKVETLLVNRDALSDLKFKKIVELAQKKQIEILEIQQQEIKRLTDTKNSQGIFCIVQQQKYDLEIILNQQHQFIVIICEGQDPGNLGTIIRTCDWFGVETILLSNGSVELYNPKVVRSTMGSIFHLSVIEGIDLHYFLPRLKQFGYSIFGCDVNGECLYHRIDYPIPLALIVGNENRGINKNFYQYLDKTVRIPSYGKAESLNMALAAAIIISRVVK